ncbi:hypothetical protein DB88DRAFT_158487 [Papiliotrema laurentii]|uniref:Uncharacterized protein n=1 Tax=Papiliotrema laurentii TaxID=5418 RepID=A0AAD9FU72_PAPLA|nr:hypothetical protein DB88DRAFT_158487 [Papiliotrema laurentii]
MQRVGLSWLCWGVCNVLPSHPALSVLPLSSPSHSISIDSGYTIPTSRTHREPNQTPFVTPSTMTLTTTLTASREPKVQPLVPLCMTQPIVQNGLTACIIWDGQVGKQGDSSGPATPNDVRFRITVPTQWCPPMHDEDGCLDTTINPYDRDLLIAEDAQPGLANVNLLDLVSGPLPPEEEGEGDGGEGKVRMSRRAQVSPSGRDLLMHIGGDILGVASKLIVAANAAGGVFRLDSVVADDQTRFDRGQACNVHLDFIFGNES